jgi:outer membrane lipoprotein-sorting protein
MKKFSFLFELLLILLIAVGVNAEPGLSGRDIMVKVDNRPEAETSKELMRIILINKAGSKRTRSLWYFIKNYGKDKKKIFCFEKPADVKKVTFLTWQYDDSTREDDRWLYMPAIKKTRRISSSSKNDYFMGTDFTYDDLGGRSVDEENHTLLKEEKLNGYDCWVVQTVSKDPKDIYGKRIAWIRKDCLISVKIDYYDRNQKLLKTLIKSEISLMSGFWTAMRMEMVNVQEKHKTIMETLKINFNVKLSDSFFTVSTLERGVI